MFFFNILFHPSTKLDTAGTDSLQCGCIPGKPKPDSSKKILSQDLGLAVIKLDQRERWHPLTCNYDW